MFDFLRSQNEKKLTDKATKNIFYVACNCYYAKWCPEKFEILCKFLKSTPDEPLQPEGLRDLEDSSVQNALKNGVSRGNKNVSKNWRPTQSEKFWPACGSGDYPSVGVDFKNLKTIFCSTNAWFIVWITMCCAEIIFNTC